MVDWMCEVLNIAFKCTCSDQTFFLAVNIMDRYISAIESRGVVFKSADLHLTGVACMFIASKYEDVYPLLMKTVFSKIGHAKLPQEAIISKEKDILQAIGFKVGGAPTPLEFIGLMIESTPQLKEHRDRKLLETISIYLAKMSLHHQDLYTRPASVIAASSIFVANKIYEQMMNLSKSPARRSILPTILSEKFLLEALREPFPTSNHSPSKSDITSLATQKEIIHSSKRLLALAQSFEKELPGLKHL